MTDPPAYPAVPTLVIVGIVLELVAVGAVAAGRRSYALGVFTATLMCWGAALVLSVPQ